MHITEDKLKVILEKSGLVDEKVFQSVKDESLRAGQTLTDVLIGRGIVPEDYLAELLEPYFGAKIVDLKKIAVPSEILELIPEAYAKSKNVILFEYDKDKGVAKLAMLDPLDYDTVEFLRAKLNIWLEPYLTTLTSLKFGLKQYKKNRRGI